MKIVYYVYVIILLCMSVKSGVYATRVPEDNEASTNVPMQVQHNNKESVKATVGNRISVELNLDTRHLLSHHKQDPIIDTAAFEGDESDITSIDHYNHDDDSYDTKKLDDVIPRTQTTFLFSTLQTPKFNSVLRSTALTCDWNIPFQCPSAIQLNNLSWGRLCIEPESFTNGSRVLLKKCSSNIGQLFFQDDTKQFHSVKNPSLCLSLNLRFNKVKIRKCTQWGPEATTFAYWQKYKRIILKYTVNTSDRMFLKVDAPVRAGKYVKAGICSTISPCKFSRWIPRVVESKERMILTQLYWSTNGDNWKNNSGWLSDNSYCDWYGVHCEDGALEWLGLINNNLVGSIPTELGGLTSSLVAIHIAYNKDLTGIVPTELGGLTSLTILDLEGNALTGAIPTELGGLTALHGLILHNNKLGGAIPTELGELTALNERLILSGNDFTGAIPTELGRLTALGEWLTLNNNKLTGTIPTELGELTNLKGLHLQNNLLTDGIPVEVCNLLIISLWACASVCSLSPSGCCDISVSGC